MQPVLFDTSVYISALRLGRDGVVSARNLSGNAPLWLSAVVLQELFAGTNSNTTSVIAKLGHDFAKAGRILVPNITDWIGAGQALARVGAKWGYEHIGKSRLAHDALIASSAGRSGIRVLTANGRDFRRLAEFTPFDWELTALQ